MGAIDSVNNRNSWIGLIKRGTELREQLNKTTESQNSSDDLKSIIVECKKNAEELSYETQEESKETDKIVELSKEISEAGNNILSIKSQFKGGDRAKLTEAMGPFIGQIMSASNDLNTLLNPNISSSQESSNFANSPVQNNSSNPLSFNGNNILNNTVKSEGLPEEDEMKKRDEIADKIAKLMIPRYSPSFESDNSSNLADETV